MSYYVNVLRTLTVGFICALVTNKFVSTKMVFGQLATEVRLWLRSSNKNDNNYNNNNNNNDYKFVKIVLFCFKIILC